MRVVYYGLQFNLTGDQWLSAALILKSSQIKKHVFFLNLDLDRVKISDTRQEANTGLYKVIQWQLKLIFSFASCTVAFVGLEI
uniref:Uncharacterized protein n=1 Tax=Amphimedon queenslandica TaxID=400682 RepID=A0A1X7UZR7_AMPQE